MHSSCYKTFKCIPKQELHIALDWTQGEETGEEADTIKYEWTASSGGFVTSGHPAGDAPKEISKAGT